MSAFQDGHPRNSNSLDEQTGLVNLINFLQEQPDWENTAVIITYDDFGRLGTTTSLPTITQAVVLDCGCGERYR